MKFAHLADCHLGGWRDPKMRELVLTSFRSTIQNCIDEKVDFVLICGDLFNTAIPGIDVIKEAVIQLRRLKSSGIPVYVIPGSHDYSPSGKTVIDVLHEADLCRNVFRGEAKDGKLSLKFTKDEKTGVKFCGILGKRGELEKNYYEMLDLKSLEDEPGTKIFLFHSPIEELRGSQTHSMQALPLSSFPKGFAYYAGGHVHTVAQVKEKGYGTFAYPGPLFPNSFSELEELKGGGYYIVELEGEAKVSRRDIKLKELTAIVMDCNAKNANEISDELISKAQNLKCEDSLVMIRLFGKLSVGSIADIRFRQIFSELYGNGAYYVMRNTWQLESPELLSVEQSDASVEEIERQVIAEHAKQIPLPEELASNEEEVLLELLSALSTDKAEGETQASHEQRIISSANRILHL